MSRRTKTRRSARRAARPMVRAVRKVWAARPMPPEDDLAAGWSLATYRACGCPYGTCGKLYEADDPDAWQIGGCAAGCGV